MNRHNLSIKLAKQAGSHLLKNFYKYKPGQADYKKDHSLVTKYDKQTEQMILKEIKKHFSNDAILSEEAGSNKKISEYLWVVDPLDGTTNFTMYNPIFSVSIGLFYLPNGNRNRAKVISGVVYWPILNKLCAAELKKGAKMNNKKISVSRNKKIVDSHITFCHGSDKKDKLHSAKYMLELKKKGIDARQLGSAAIELSLVASGRIESIAIPGANPWDVAAGVLLVREAGGRVTDIDGKDWQLGSRDMIASNGLLHNQVLKIFKNAK